MVGGEVGCCLQTQAVASPLPWVSRCPAGFGQPPSHCASSLREISLHLSCTHTPYCFSFSGASQLRHGLGTNSLLASGHPVSPVASAA